MPGEIPGPAAEVIEDEVGAPAFRGHALFSMLFLFLASVEALCLAVSLILHSAWCNFDPFGSRLEASAACEAFNQHWPWLLGPSLFASLVFATGGVVVLVPAFSRDVKRDLPVWVTIACGALCAVIPFLIYAHFNPTN
jgi:hypothetical protein